MQATLPEKQYGDMSRAKKRSNMRFDGSRASESRKNL